MQLKRLNFEVNNGGGGERWRHFTRRRKVGNTRDARRAAFPQYSLALLLKQYGSILHRLFSQKDVTLNLLLKNV
jgi:hypothetical protein